MSNDDGAKPIKPPSTGALIAKAAAGVLFLVTGFTNLDRGFGFLATAAIIGLALIAWGAVGFLNSKKAWEEYQAGMQAQEQQRVRVCKVCGARSTGSACEYCGSPLE